MRDLARVELDRIDKLRPGQGMLEAYMGIRGDLTGGLLGGFVDYRHRVTERDAVFVQGSAGYGFGANPGFAYDATVGWRHTF